MERVCCSLRVKLTISFLALVLAVSGLTGYVMLRESREVALEMVRSELTGLASVLASDFSGADGDVLMGLKAGEERTPRYMRLRDRLRRLKEAHGNIMYAYTMRKRGDDLYFIVDADYGYGDDPEEGAIDEKYDLDALKGKSEILSGFEGPAADREFSEDKWGVTLSGYAPVRNSSGQVIGILGVDMARQEVIAKAKELRWKYAAAVLVVGAFVSGLLVLFYSITVRRDVRRMIKAANDISMGDMDATVGIERNDEIGELAESFERMVASLKIMMKKEK